jgi:hypothetical protein
MSRPNSCQGTKIKKCKDVQVWNVTKIIWYNKHVKAGTS